MISKVAASLVLLAIILMFAAAGEQLPSPSPPQLYVVTKYEGKLLELEREAINDAFRAKITQLWTVWMSDDKGQPARAVTGAAQARKAYIASMQEIDRREEENKKR
jgi:hypothetical protein